MFKGRRLQTTVQQIIVGLKSTDLRLKKAVKFCYIKICGIIYK